MDETQGRSEIEIEIEAIIPEGWEYLVTRDRGQVWVELAAPVGSECCPTQARPRPIEAGLHCGDARSADAAEPEWVAWDYHPLDTSDIVDVTVSELLGHGAGR